MSSVISDALDPVGSNAATEPHVELPPSTLLALLDDAVSRFGPRPCTDFLGRSTSYGELGASVERVAGGLSRLGVVKGTRVGLCMPNSPFYVVAFFAVMRAGGIVVNYNPLYVAEELAAQVADSGTSVMITVDIEPLWGKVAGLLANGALSHVVVCRFAAAMPPVKALLYRIAKRASVAAIPSDPRVVAWRSLVRSAPIAAPPVVHPDDLAVLQYTGGTTGVPKGAMLTHANLAANARQMREWVGLDQPGRGRVLAVLPFFHVFAMTVALTGSLSWGSEIIILPRFELAQVRAVLRRKRPTIFPGVPTIFKAMLDAGVPAHELASIRMCISGGAPLPHEVQRAFEPLIAGKLLEGYGLTEASPVAFCNPAAGDNRAGTIGRPLPAVEVSIRTLDDCAIDVSTGEPGEVCLRGPNIMRGYWNRPDESASAFTPDGFLRTGDVGIADADGYVTLVDRIKDLILCSGFNVYPRTIEEALYRHPDVAAATALGMPDPYRGETVVAFVQPKPGTTVTPAGILAFLADKLSPIEMPRRIEIRAELPRTAVGKLSRKELRAELLVQG